MNRALLHAQMAALFAGLLCFLALVVMHIRVGFELGDGGFYLLHISQPQNISFTLTHFGLVWQSLFGDQGVLANRALNLGLLLSASACLIVTCRHVLVTALPRKEFAIFCALAVLGCSGQLAIFILDPSYNSMAQSFVLFGIAMITLASDQQGKGRVWRVMLLSFGAGFVIAALVIIKASTAIAFMGFAVIAAGVMAWQARAARLFAYMLVAGLMGAAAFFGFLELSTGQMGHILTGFLQGYEAYASAATHSASLLGWDALRRLLRFVFGVETLFPGGWIVLVFALTSLLGLMAKPAAEAPHRPWALILPAALFGLGAVALLVSDTGLGTNLKINGTAFVIGWWIAIAFWRRGRFSLPENIFLLGLLFAPFMALYGTVNAFTFNIFAFGAAFSLLPAWIIVARSPARHAPVAGHLILSLGLLVAVVSAINALHNPYRLLAPLTQARAEVTFPDGSPLLLPPGKAAFLTGLGDHAHQGGDPAPMVFDLTGELPITPYWLQGRSTGAAWIVRRFSSDFSRKIFAAAGPQDILGGWVLLQLDETGAIDRSAAHVISFEDRLQGLGATFESHFAPVATLTAPSFANEARAMQVTLFKPAKDLAQ